MTAAEIGLLPSHRVRLSVFLFKSRRRGHGDHQNLDKKKRVGKRDMLERGPLKKKASVKDTRWCG